MSESLDRRTILAAVESLEAQIAAIRRAIGAEKGPIASPPDLIDPDLIELALVAKAMRRSKAAARKWLDRHGLKVSVGGRVYARETELRAALGRPT